MKKLVKHFSKKVSMIVPVYNVEQYLRGCLDSLIAQTIDPNEMEILLINDGSTDNSLEICREYEGQYNNIKIFDKPNSGVSDTRNVGIRNAIGKYIMYLDSDDMLTPETVKSVTDFFDKVYDQVDLVTYFDQVIKDGGEMDAHFRYKYFKNTDVYDLNDFPYITQTRINICIKNLLNDNTLFDTTMPVHEDQKYVTDILTVKMKIGYCSKGKYNYIRDNNLSLTSIFDSNPIKMFETVTKYYEDEFGKYENVPPYVQAMFLNNFNWKLYSDILFPYHYEGKQFENAIDRLRKLMDKVDVKTIMQFPLQDNYRKIYFINFKTQPNLVPYVTSQRISVACESKVIYNRKDVELMIKRIHVSGRNVKILGYIKSPIFAFTEKPRLFVYNNNVRHELDIWLASTSYGATKSIVNNNWAFTYWCENVEQNQIYFEVETCGIIVQTIFNHMDTEPFSKYTTLKSYVNSNIKFSLSGNNKLNLTLVSDEEFFKSIDNITTLTTSYKTDEIKKIRNKAKKRLQQKEVIWLYTDDNTVTKDNGYFQFINDFEKNDGVKRFYVVTSTYHKEEESFSKEHEPYLIVNKSLLHKELYLSCEKILTAFIERKVVCPFKPEEIPMIIDMTHHEIIYLQHGVLHAHLPWYYTPIGVDVDKVVVSSQFEIDNFSSNYGFLTDEIIPTGMPRFDILNKSHPPQNKIIYAPSWRSYLTGKLVDSDVPRQPDEEKLLSSSYYKGMMSFLTNPMLYDVLTKNDIYLDLKLHPQFYTTYRHLVNIENDRINLASNWVELEDYAAFITDFSSYTFNFAYFNRPILYYVPDMLEFKAGLNFYKELDLPFEKAFGKLAATQDEAVDEMQKIIKNNFIPEEIYKKRMENFYLQLENCREKLYLYLMQNNL